MLELGFYLKPSGGDTISFTLLEAVWLPSGGRHGVGATWEAL